MNPKIDNASAVVEMNEHLEGAQEIANRQI